jgi:threonine aldolase
VVAGDASFVRRVRRIRKMLGGGMRQTGVLAAAGLVGLEGYPRLAEDHENARRLAEGLAAIDGIEVDPATVTTNIVLFRVSGDRFTWQTFAEAAARQGVAVGEFGHGRLRAALHSGVSAHDVDRTVSIVAHLLSGTPSRESRPVPIGAQAG